MKFSYQWLREWVDPGVSAEELGAALTMAGLELEGIEPVAGDFEGVVVGEVLGVQPHPDADKLRVCRVEVGQDRPLSIVCGAANVHTGLRVPTALLGARLPGLSIKKAKLRGVASEGMLCSARELGLAEASEGLLELPGQAPVGEDLRRYLALDDVALELGLTPNRADCLSVAGIAREVGVLFAREPQGPAVEPASPQTDARLEVVLEAPEDCPHYAGRVIEGVNPRAATPLWMQERLRRSGVRSLGPLVDVTNYVMLELGQPLHAFDRARLSGGVYVRHSRAGEHLVLLDGRRLELEPGTLLIADEARPLALAGIMGGQDSAVGDETRDIFLESAYFSPLAIAGRARGYGLHTESSHRFERGVAPDLQRLALERATALLLDIAGGRPGPVCEVASEAHLPRRPPVRLRAARVPRVLGTDLAPGEVETILTRLGLRVEAREDGWEAVPPAFRFDLEREEDLLEELARIHGYDALPSTRPREQLAMAPRPEAALGLRRLRAALVDRGYQEAITYSFVPPQLQRLLDPEHRPLALANPLSAELSVMRTSLWPGLVQAALHNLNRQQSRVRLFEAGLKFVRRGADIEQESTLAGLVSGDAYPQQWGVPGRAADFFDIKGDVEALAALTGQPEAFSCVPRSHPALHPGQSAALRRDGQDCGWVGALHPAVLRELGLGQPVLVFELSLAALSAGRVPHYRELSRFPAIRRDLAIVVDEAVSAAKVQAVVAEAAADLLQKLELFDVYKGKGIDSGRKSLALGLTLQDLSRTLTDSDVESVINRIIKALHTRFGATLRE